MENTTENKKRTMYTKQSIDIYFTDMVLAALSKICTKDRKFKDLFYELYAYIQDKLDLPYKGEITAGYVIIEQTPQNDEEYDRWVAESGIRSVKLIQTR